MTAVLDHMAECSTCLGGHGDMCDHAVSLASGAIADDVYIHPTAVVDAGVRLGKGTKVWAHAVIRTGARLGAQCAVGPSAFVGVNARLGDHVRIQHAAHITDHMEIGDRVFIANGVMSGNDRMPVVNNPHFHREAPVIEDDASIGMAAVLLPGVRIGRGAMVGGGAVVTKDVAPYAVVVGNPARPMETKRA